MPASAALLHAALFDASAPRADRPAVVWPTGALTHAELLQSARRIAGRLAALGIGPGHRVALCLPKCAEAVQAIVGILSVGAAYVPLDPAQPPLRLAAQLRDAQPSLLLATPAILARLANGAARLPPRLPIAPQQGGTGLAAWADGAAALDPRLIDPDAIAALLYTSGSTGEPKAVTLSHRNVVSFVEWATRRFELHADDRFTSHAPFHFDLSMLDLFAPLALGASVALIDEKTARFPAAVVDALAAHACTIWYSVPTALHWMHQRGGLGERPLPALRSIFFAGEVFPVPQLRNVMQALPGRRFVNWYGPTETNVCTYYVVPEPPAETATAIPIGVACEHLEVQVRDVDGRVLPAGTVGELCVSGPAVMRGYWQRPEETEAVRIGGRPDSYRTGDLARIDADGALIFHGRRDQQVKLRGHRVELEEIERVLLADADLGAAAVVCSGGADLDARLVAFVVAADQRVPSARALQRRCAAALPAYAVPSLFVPLTQLPLTSRGKLDRAALTERARAYLRNAG